VIDACSLLTSEEIQSVQGEPVTEAKATGNAAGGFSQCHFALPTFSNSVSILVQAGTTANGREPKRAWDEMFSPAKLEASETEGGKKKFPARRIPDLGDEAYWAGNNMIGVLHVLKGDRYFTISVGGAGDQNSKIEKCSALARVMLKRL